MQSSFQNDLKIETEKLKLKVRFLWCSTSYHLALIFAYFSRHAFVIPRNNKQYSNARIIMKALLT